MAIDRHGDNGRVIGRPYEPDRDREAVIRQWREAGWIDYSDAHATALADVFAVGDAVVAEARVTDGSAGTATGSAECALHRSSGSLRYGVGDRATDLPLSLITAVTTSHVARRQGLAASLIASALGDAAANGAAVATLGIFDQGYYERFGFGTGADEHVVSFDPATLDVPVPDRAPVRIGAGNHREVYDLLLRRLRGHGSVVLDLPELIAADLALLDRPVGLGFRAEDGRLTHCLIGTAEAHHGPLNVEWLIHEEPHQLEELLGLLKSLGDQYRSVTIAHEPPGVQLQSLLAEPLRQLSLANLGAAARPLHTSWSKVQWRILDLAACIEACTMPGVDLTFGLRLHDPLADRWSAPWRGLGGDYTVHLGERSRVDVGPPSGSTPVLEASVGAFTRLWLGVRPATGLTITDALAGPPELIAGLDAAFGLPPPLPDWPF